VTVARATLAASSAQSASVRAAAKYSDLREQLGAFASASFRGARLGQLSALLTAESSSDYLDEVSSLDHVAGRTQKLMIRALKAKRQADSASDKADDAQQKAVGARQKADKAVEAAHRATQNVTHRKSDLESRVKKYHQLFNRLSASERRAAMRAQQEAWEKQTRQAQREAKKEARRDAQRWAQQESPQTGAFGDGADGGPGTSGNGEDGHAGDGASSAVRSKAEKAVRAALTKLGNPYVYGTAGPTTFDCSGLTSWAWAQAGVSIPRTSAAQGRLQSVPLDQLEPGDLVTYYSPVHHVALYIGHGQIIDASTEGRPIFITSVYRGGPYPTGHRVTY
jgi:cell wall-associated NlpC family hydrolase